jgi:hypothetical protein
MAPRRATRARTDRFAETRDLARRVAAVVSFIVSFGLGGLTLSSQAVEVRSSVA